MRWGTPVIIFSFLAAAVAQTPAPPPAAAQRLAPGDEITVSVYQAPELATTARLEPDGSFTMPAAGRVLLAGQTAAGAAALLAERLGEHYLQHPQVEVTVREFAAEPVTVMGAVQHPGVYSARLYPDLAAMLAAAGGVEPHGGDHITLERDGRVAASESVDAWENQGGAAALPLQAGDRIRVTPAATVYVGGDVAHPGAFPLPTHGLTLLQALILAGGIDPHSQSGHTRIVRRLPGGAMQTRWIDAGRVLRAQAPDPLLQPFDLVYVPSSAARRALAETLHTLAVTSSAIVSGVVIWH
ncbi:MAG TPA: polysaccharide biosynthesis/export family protein [Terriglobales bacterium]|nr:polysaccharide biosynthesis/export family protein [Terriglobales bacterium]